MADKGIFIYAVRDEDSMQGFILVASEVDIDVENSKAEKVGVYHIHSVKNKPYNYTVNKKLTNVRLDEFMSVVDEDLYEFNEKNRTLVFDKKGYDNLIGQLMDDLEEENDDDSSEEEEKKKKKPAPKAASARKTRSSKGSDKVKGSDSESYEAADEEDEEEKKRSRGRPKKNKSTEEITEDKDENSQEDQPKPKGKRGRPPSKDKAASVAVPKKQDKQDDKDGEENGEDQNGHEENGDEDKEEGEQKRVPGKRGRKPGKKTAETPAKKEAQQNIIHNRKPQVFLIQRPGKRGRKPAKKGSESEDNEDADDEQEEVSKKGAKKKVEKYKKGSHNPNIPDVVKTDETFEGDSQDINDVCCSFCTNRELLRAVYTGNSNLLKKLVQSKAKVSTLFAKRGPDADETTLEIILKNKDKKCLDVLINALNKKSEISLASNPECSLEEVYTGFNDRFAYGVPTRKVQMARGGKEGNNAFVADINSFVDTQSWNENERLIFSLLENETEVQFLEFLRGLKDENLTTSLLEKTYVAVRAGNRKTASYLMKQANKFGGYGFNNLHEQVLSLDDVSKLDEFKKVSITKKSTGVYSKNSYGFGGAQGIITPIHCAAINPNPEFIKKLLEISPEFTIPDDLMRKPVHYAATCEGPGPLSYLLKQGVDAREGDKKKITPLMLACQFGRAKNVEILLDANGKSNPDTRTREGYRAIHYAAHYGHLDCIKLMIEKGGVEVDSPGPKRMTPLHIATSRGHFEIVEYLLSKGAKVIVKDKFKRSAVIHATANGYLKILSLILKNGGPFNDPDSSGNYPVHYAAAYGFQACLDLLKQAGADFNPQNSWNLTPLSIAMAKGHFGMVKKLLNYPECDVNCTDVKGRTIISRATEKLNLNNLSQFEFILKEKKANPNMADLQGQSPLHYLCNLSKDDYVSKRQNEENAHHVTKKYEEEYEKIVQKATQILLDCGADINKLNTMEESPLTIAIKQQNFFILNILLKKGGLDFSHVNQIDQNILHTLNTLILEGPSGIDQFYNIFEEIKKDKNVNLKEYLNKVDYHGFSPLLMYVKIFSENASHYREQRVEELSQEIYSKKGGSAPNKKNPIKKQAPTRGPRVAKKAIRSAPAKSLIGFSNDGALVQLTEKELEKVQKQADEDLLQFEQKFQKLITFLVEKGSDVEAKVQKIKKYRSNMDVEDKSDNEEQQEQDEDDDENEGNKTLKDEMGNPIQNKKVKYIPEYNSCGEMNIFGLALSHLSLPYLKFIHEQYPQLVNNVDYLKRNHLHKFILKNDDEPATNVSHKVLEWLTTLKIDINQKDIIESTPLISAISQKKYKFAKTLINHKAQVDVKDIFGKTPLIMAINNIQSNNLEFVEYLLSNGASANFADNYGRTPLHHAINKADKGANASFDLENLLIKNKADINAADSLGRTPLHYCFVSLQDQQYSTLQYDPFETVSSLCNQSNIKIDVKDNLGKTPLHYAAQKNSTISVIYMIEKKANIDIEDANGNTPLAVAFRFKRSEITTTLIQNGANTSKFITINKNLKPNGEEEEEYKEPAKDHWGNPIKTRRRQNYSSYGSRYLFQYQNQYDGFGGDQNSNNSIIKKLLSEYHIEEDSYIELVKRSITKEQFKEKGLDNLVFQEFRVRGDLPLGKHSFFKASITFQWQGIAYLLLIKGNYNLFNALEDAIKIDLYQLSITLLFKYPEDETITQCNSEGQNLIHILCQRSPRDVNLQVKLFETLLNRGVDAKKLDNKKNLCLHFAFLHHQLTPKLLELGLDCNAYNDDQQTPFALAIQEDAKQALKIYTANYKPDYSKKFKAKLEGHQDYLQFTPLLIQFANKNKDLVLLNHLLANGSNINEVDNLGRNALYYAIYHNSHKLVKFVLQTKKFDVKHVDNQGKNAVHYVVNPVEFGSYENTEILELLHNAKIDFNVKDKDGNTAMFYALQQDSKKMAESLKKYGVEALKEKKLPQRAATSIVTDALFPDEEIDYEEDSKKFSEETTYDQYKEFFEQKNAGDKVYLDKYVAGNYKKKDNYVVLDDNNEPYNLLMTKVDLGGGFAKYVFYIMQVIHDKNSDVYILYTRWGHMGGMGQMQHTPFATKEAAVKEFSKIFYQKSGNDWTNRHNFKKQDKKYQLVIFEKGNDKKSFSLKPYDFERLNCSASQLEKPIQEFIKNISNAEIFKQAYRQFALSDQYLPITKLSKAALIEAQGILADIREEVIEIQKLRSKLTQGNNMQLLLEREESVLRYSNRYYELVPRAVSKWEPAQPLNHEHNISQEQRLVENLLDFEAAIKIIMGSYTKLQVMHPLDYCFNSLSIRMKQIQNEHPEYKMIQQYVSRTNHKATDPNSQFIRNVFAVERRGEAERIKQFSDHTKKLLWHGSGVQNLLSILNFGLRINGIHAQKSGSSLGDGIYFADLFSKASAYANNADVGVESRFLLLCEVAVGKEQQIKTNENFTKFANSNYQLMKGFNSVKLVGKSCPDEKKNLVLPNGTIVPIGPIIDFNENLKQKLQIEKSTKKSAKKSTKKPAQKIPARPIKKVVKATKYSSDEENSQDEESQIQVEEDELDIPEDEIQSDGDEEIEEEEDNFDEEQDEQNLLQNNFLYDVQHQGAKTPFNQLFTQYQNSEYVVYNSAQVRIRYLIEIRD
ncbi:WGR domain protein (macronuclear) [Tetrahymena thermophila SB210]|uniref:Poly [ADP-ribose] polymerase n=1 Tax=Tetrahymena thermophila (strain SB210) TaxID=312017 RepID=I7MGV0_TETTS|nr:WGR domain protein [Tetrahymena thermophila SB210]EAS02069.2 WGR domain protein [Tetrahymena thermophila SB210]|eukprot:XP_001022314.2 WGR domain protein [Tetrahymena thermophila SB210]